MFLSLTFHTCSDVQAYILHITIAGGSRLLQISDLVLYFQGHQFKLYSMILPLTIIDELL